ncbi:TonB-dependent receptor plug domain-containing protein [Methylobacterium oryzae CBMB20]
MAGTGDGNTRVDGYRVARAVSATRTDTPVREVPQTIVAVPQEVLEDAAATRIDSALDLAGVGRGNNFGGLGLTEFTIRGVATGEYYRNGFPINRGYPNSPDIVSIERIEVLKGPLGLPVRPRRSRRHLQHRDQAAAGGAFPHGRHAVRQLRREAEHLRRHGRPRRERPGAGARHRRRRG